MQARKGDSVRTELRLLGEPRFLLGETDITPRSKRGRALIAFLALSRGHVAQRARLAEIFWGDRGEEQARGSLRQCLLEIRGAVGPDLLRSGREEVALAGDWTSDVAEIERLLAAGDPQSIAAAIERAGRDTLLGALYVSDEFDEWLNIARSAFDSQLAEGARRGLGRALETGDTEAARRIADQYLMRDPGDEEVTVLAMRADAARGAAPVAHRRFQKLRDYLATELGAAPGPAAVQALSALATAPTPLAAAAPEPAGGPPLLVVGPFTETGFASDIIQLGAGVRDEVISGLSRFRDIRVLADERLPSTSEAPLYGNLGRAYALTANLRFTDGRTRVTPVLTRLADRAVVWSRPIDVASAGLEGAIDGMVDRIIGAAAPHIERDVLHRPSSGNIFERFLYARQRSYFTTDLAEAKWAVDELEAIIAEAPTMAVAYPPLVRLYNTCYGYMTAGIDSAPMRARAYTLAQTALSLDRGHVHAYTVMGWCHLWRNETAAAQFHLDQAAELNPYHSERLKEVSFGNMFIGNLDQAERLINRSLALDPLPNDNFFEDVGFLNLMRGNFEKANEYLDLISKPTIFASLYSAMSKAQLRSLSKQQWYSSADTFFSRLRSIWSADVPMTDPDIVDWLNSQLPFQNAEARSYFNDILSNLIGKYKEANISLSAGS